MNEMAVWLAANIVLAQNNQSCRLICDLDGCGLCECHVRKRHTFGFDNTLYNDFASQIILAVIGHVSLRHCQVIDGSDGCSWEIRLCEADNLVRVRSARYGKSSR